MAKGSPSMLALLGLLAVAGYQNRDKLSDLLAGAGGQGNAARSPERDDPNAPGLIDNLRDMFAGGSTGSAGGGMIGGLSELLARFTNPVQSAKARTWVDIGPNSDLSSTDLEEVLDEETLADLSQKTGLDRNELLSRLSVVLPEAVDRLTPDGRLHSDPEPPRIV